MEKFSDSESGGPGFDPHCVVSLSKTNFLSRVLFNTQKEMALSRHDSK